jgi:hypothetical protein
LGRMPKMIAGPQRMGCCCLWGLKPSWIFTIYPDFPDNATYEQRMPDITRSQKSTAFASWTSRICQPIPKQAYLYTTEFMSLMSTGTISTTDVYSSKETRDRRPGT